jgi:hypothetical protein
MELNYEFEFRTVWRGGFVGVRREGFMGRFFFARFFIPN